MGNYQYIYRIYFLFVLILGVLNSNLKRLIRNMYTYKIDLFNCVLSIEDAKQKAEHDKMMKIADEKKKDVRRQIAKLRRQFKSILEQNEGLPPHLQLRKEVCEFYSDGPIV